MRLRPEYRRAGAILFFAPLPDELDLWPLFEEGLRENRVVALPRFARGQFGITEPSRDCRVLALNRLDLVFVPGVGFDRRGRRLGRGRGYYDRLLVRAAGFHCGAAMDWQVLAALPVEPHDRNLDCILTPTRWLVFARCAARK